MIPPEAEGFAKAESYDNWAKQNPNGHDASGTGTDHAKKASDTLIADKLVACWSLANSMTARSDFSIGKQDPL
jgi:hypothetical protein